MGQPAGVKRRKRKIGNLKVHKNRQTETKRKKKQGRKGIPMIGLEDCQGGRSVLTRVEEGGLVANVKKHFKPDRRMFVEGIGEKLLRKPAPKTEPKETRLAENVSELRAKAKAKALERRTVVVSKPTVKRLEYFLDRYGEDYKAMARDPMNYDQWTERQIQVKILGFKKTSYQFAEFLKDRGLLQPELLSAPRTEQNSEQQDMDVDEQEPDVAACEARAKLQEKISALEESEAAFNKSIVAKVPRPSLIREERKPSSDQDETDGEEEAREGKKSNRRRRERIKKSKKAKLKTLKKVIRQSL